MDKRDIQEEGRAEGAAGLPCSSAGAAHPQGSAVFLGTLPCCPFPTFPILLLNLLFDLLHVHLSPLAITAVSKRQMLNHFFWGGVKVYTVLLPLGLSVT